MMIHQESLAAGMIQPASGASSYNEQERSCAMLLLLSVQALIWCTLSARIMEGGHA